MRTTVRIDDDLLMELKERARRERLSLSRFLNRVIRRGLAPAGKRQKPPSRYREKVCSMGQPLYPLEKALALADALEDEEVRAKLAARK